MQGQTELPFFQIGPLGLFPPQIEGSTTTIGGETGLGPFTLPERSAGVDYSRMTASPGEDRTTGKSKTSQQQQQPLQEHISAQGGGVGSQLGFDKVQGQSLQWQQQQRRHQFVGEAMSGPLEMGMGDGGGHHGHHNLRQHQGGGMMQEMDSLSSSSSTASDLPLLSALSISGGGGGWVGSAEQGHGQDGQGYGAASQQMMRPGGNSSNMSSQQASQGGGSGFQNAFSGMAESEDIQQHVGYAQQGGGGRGGTSETDEDLFAMYVFKVVHCSKQFVHDWKECPYAHEGETARRRHPNQHTAQPCPNFKSTKMCPRFVPVASQECIFSPIDQLLLPRMLQHPAAAHVGFRRAHTSLLSLSGATSARWPTARGRRACIPTRFGPTCVPTEGTRHESSPPLPPRRDR